MSILMSEVEIIYKIEIINQDIIYFKKYKTNLKKFFLNQVKDLSKNNISKFLIELELIALNISKLHTDKKEYLELLNILYYGNTEQTNGEQTNGEQTSS